MVWSRNSDHINQKPQHTQHIQNITMATPVTSATVQTFQAKFYIDKRDVGMVIGGKGKTINGIKRTHGVDVRIMDSDRADGKQFFLITGSDSSKVDAAYKNIDQIAANSERKRQTAMTAVPQSQVPAGAHGYGSPHLHDSFLHPMAPPGYTVSYAGHNYIIPNGMVLVPAQLMPQAPAAQHGSYTSVPVTPQKPKGGRKVRRKKNPPPMLNVPNDIPTGVPCDAQPPMPRRSEYPSSAPYSPDYMPHTPDGPPPATPPADGRIADWSAEDKTGGSGADAQ